MADKKMTQSLRKIGRHLEAAIPTKLVVELVLRRQFFNMPGVKILIGHPFYSCNRDTLCSD